MQKERIAIIGVGCRFPGGVHNSETFWKLLTEGREAVSEIPADRFNIERYYDEEPGLPGKSMAKRGGFIDNIDLFDPRFFGISAREAPYVDPQHRLLLETAWEAIEDAGLVLDFEKGTDLGVFVGISHNDYQGIQSGAFDHFNISAHTATGSAHSVAANRISYCLNLRGPSVAMDTACSSALTAVHSACEHIWTGRGDAALAGGVTIMITPGGFIGFSQAAMLSPEGRCAAFDASASGFVRGEGAGMVLLKRLSKAIEDGDPIQGVILGTSINQDGHTNGISLPSPEAQARLVRDACRDAGVDPKDIGYVEAHGTGTAVGDPIEAHALAEALCPDRSADAPLAIGSCKTNLGHLETAAGVAGLVKAMLVLKHRQIPPSLHFTEPSPHIDFEKLKLRVPTELEPFPQTTSERLVGVNSFGFGGANAHVILAEAPAAARRKPSRLPEDRAWPLVLSARSEEALKGSARQLAEWIDQHARSNGSTPLLSDLVFTLGARRNHHPYRLTFTAASLGQATEKLQEFVADADSPLSRTSFSPQPETEPRVAFVMSGQGPQWFGMGRELMEHEPVFREAMERCAQALGPWTDFSLLDELAKEEADSQIQRTAIGQPAIFAMQYSLAALWQSWGIQPAAIVGHSVGELAAACVAGILPLEEGARIIALRAKLMDQCARGEGLMLAVGLNEEEVSEVIARHDPTVTISAYNGPRSLTLSGPEDSIRAMAAELEGENVFARIVKVDHPFHHALMQPAADQLAADLADLEPQAGQIPFFSTVTGARQSGEACDGTYWGRGIRQAVKFAPAIDALAEFGVDVWLEISAHPALARSINECLTAREEKATVVSSTRRESEHESMLEAALDLHRACVPVDFRALTPSRQILTLPAYAWEKARWWSETPDSRESRLSAGGKGFLEMRLPRAQPTWIARFDSRHAAFLKDHKVENHVIFPAAGFVEMALEAGQQLFEGRPFALEDFEIRKPLFLPEPITGVQLELSYQPADRTFTIQSRFDLSPTWSLHVVGSLRGERTESTFAAEQYRNGATAPSLDVTEFYEHMSELGLRYGEEFRPIREIHAGKGTSGGRVSLSEAIAKRAGEYALHPVLFDGALQIFSAAAATIEDRRARMKLPVHFGRILYLGSPGTSARVKASVRAFNDDFLEGDLELFDETGKPCVRIDSFRAIAVSGTKRAGRDLAYHVAWQRTEIEGHKVALKPAPLQTLHDAAQTALNDVLDLRGRDAIVSALFACDDLAASQLASGLSAMGVAGGRTFSAKSIGVAQPMERVFERLARGLEKHGLFARKSGGQWQATDKFDAEAARADEALREFIDRHPGHLPEALLCVGNCQEFGPILRAEKDAVQVLFAGMGAELLDQFYGDGLFTSHWVAAISAAVSAAAQRLPEGRGLRILEVGAGTGGLAAQVLPGLERGLHQYIFTDVSAAFFSSSGQKLAAFPEVEFKIFDLEKPGTEQGFDADSFDLVIGTNVIHAVKDVTETLAHLQDLLTPGGSLLFMETATPQLWSESVFGLTSGWWRFTDTKLRPEQPLLERAQWESVLHQVGFAEVSSLAGLIGPSGGEGQTVLMAQKADAAPADVAADEDDASAQSRCLIFAEDSELSQALIARWGDRGTVVRSGSRFGQKNGQFTIDATAPEDWTQLLSACSTPPPDRIVYLWTLDADPATLDREANALLLLTQSIDAQLPAARIRLDLVTRGAQAAGRVAHKVAVAQAPAIGLMRVILNEYTNLSCHSIDLAPEPSPRDLDQLWSELACTSGEREVAFRGEARYVQRLDRGLPPQAGPLEKSWPLRLETTERGHLDALRFSPFRLPECGPGQVLIDVKAAGMNFRDVLKALGLYPGEAPDARIFGDEVAGTVRAIGEGVTHVKPGDRVFGLAVFGMATQTLARGGDVCKIPSELSFEEAATLPVVFMTSWHALHNVARMRQGETILVHAGAGGVGMAAVQIALELGAEVIASAGSPAKRALLQTLGVKHVVDSRRGDFAEAVMECTNRRGVDVVLNALAGEAIPMGLSCLAEFGRFIEIGKRDIYQNSRIPLRPLRSNASFHVVAMDAVFHGDESLTRDLLAGISSRVEAGSLQPLPFRAFPANRADAAFRLIASGKHIGKVIVSFAEPFVPTRGEPLADGFEVRADGAYLITGAFGGYGMVLTDWLVQCGARHLILVSRSGPSTPEALAHVEKLEAQGVSVAIEKADIGSPEIVEGLFASIAAGDVPLRGVFHLAMVIDDAPLARLTPDRMRAVIEPKAQGAWLLHEATREMALDCFVLFSSISSIFGNPGQGNYSAANAFLDALTHHRHALGLPALTVNWGVLGGQGYVARNTRVAEFLARQGTHEIKPSEAMALLESFLQAGSPEVIAIRVDWAKWRQFFRSMQEVPLLERIFATLEDEVTGGGASDWRNRIEAAAPEEKLAVICEAVRSVVGSVLRVKPDSLRNDQPLTDLGLDSLMGVEIETSLEAAVGVSLPPTSLMRARTIGQIGTLIADHLSGDSTAPATTPALAAETEGEVDLEALSDEDLDLLVSDDVR